ncbi:MAG: winged helix-turn-helix transcriptional regulator [Thaumarchaeota archaeon]|nr:winged helix-turn-helix transcriptional regulator [Nitrososphaerota archaeon]
MSKQALQKLSLKAKLFRGLGDPTRLSILESIRNGSKTVGDIVGEIGQSQSNVSNHLACLRDCNLVTPSRRGRSVAYGIRNDKVKELLSSADAVLSEVYEELYRCVNYNQP